MNNVNYFMFLDIFNELGNIILIRKGIYSAFNDLVKSIGFCFYIHFHSNDNNNNKHAIKVFTIRAETLELRRRFGYDERDHDDIDERPRRPHPDIRDNVDAVGCLLHLQGGWQVY